MAIPTSTVRRVAPVSAPVTVTVARIVQVAMAAGLNPHTSAVPYRGAVELRFNAGGVDGTFGYARIGARTGRVLAASLRLGNEGPSYRYDDGRALLRGLRVLPRALVRYHGSIAAKRGATLVVAAQDPWLPGRFVLAEPDDAGDVLRRVRRESFTPTGEFVPHTPTYC